MGELIKVGMADINTCVPPQGITTLGLGSCVGVVLYDAVKKVSGMVHVMLPDSNTIRNNANPAKFADTGVALLYDKVIAMGADKRRIQAKIAGGAQMFVFSSGNDMLRIGDRNVQAVKEQLKKLNIPIVAEDTGLNYGRTIEFYPENQKLIVKSVGKPLKVL